MYLDMIGALPCLCVDVFDGTDELYAGGEALNLSFFIPLKFLIFLFYQLNSVII